MSAPAVKQSLPASGTPPVSGPASNASANVQKLSSVSSTKPPGSGSTNHNLSNIPLSLVQDHKNGSSQNQPLAGLTRGPDKNRDLTLKPTSNGVEGSPTKTPQGLMSGSDTKKLDESQSVANHSAELTSQQQQPGVTTQESQLQSQLQLQQIQLQQLLPQQHQQQLLPQQQQMLSQQHQPFMGQGMNIQSQQILPQQQMLSQQAMNQLLMPPQQIQAQQMIQSQQQMSAQQQIQGQHMQQLQTQQQQQLQTQQQLQAQPQMQAQQQIQAQNLPTQQQVPTDVQIQEQSVPKQQEPQPVQQLQTEQKISVTPSVPQIQTQQPGQQLQEQKQQPQQQMQKGGSQEVPAQEGNKVQPINVTDGQELKAGINEILDGETGGQKHGEKGKDKESPPAASENGEKKKDDGIAQEKSQAASCSAGASTKEIVKDTAESNASGNDANVAETQLPTEETSVRDSTTDNTSATPSAGQTTDNQVAGPSSVVTNEVTSTRPRNDAPKSEFKVATPPRSSKRKRETKPSGEKSEGKEPTEERKSKRVRTRTQPYQAPLPELPYISKLKTLMKSPDDKLIVFYKNEFLAVRNTEGGFYVCQALQNIYRSSPRIRIRWLSQDKEEMGSKVYIPDFYDATDFDCILTNLELKKVDKNKYELPKEERDRTESILTRALQCDNGGEKPPVTEEHPDGLDLSLYKDESQLKKRRSGKKRACKRASNSAPEGTSTSAADGDPAEPAVKKAKTKPAKKAGTAKTASKEKSKTNEKEATKKSTRDSAREKRNSGKKKIEKTEKNEVNNKAKRNSSTSTKSTTEKKNSKASTTKKADSSDTNVPTRSAKTRSVKAAAAPSKTSPITRTKERERREVNAKERKKPGKKA